MKFTISQLKFNQVPSKSSDLNGWIKWKDQTPTDDQWPIFVTASGKSEVFFLYSKTASAFPPEVHYDNALWVPVNIPNPPKAKNSVELENDAILDAWRRRGIDYAHDNFIDISQDFFMGWAACKDWVAKQKL